MAYRGANTDRISHIPIEIIEKILNLLPCRDAVRTSILSSDWRYKWTSMSDLNFGDAWSTADKHAKFINQCLLRHQGPIRKFGVRSNTLTVGCNIGQWMQLVSKHDIEELQIVSGSRNLDHPIFPSCLFNCKKLTHLELSGYILDVPATFEGFLNLKVLKLSIAVGRSSSIERLISMCPLLESLSLCVFGSSNVAITISAPKIKYLSLQGHFKGTCLEKSPGLIEMSLNLYGYQSQSDLFKILGGAPNLEKLAAVCFQRRCYQGVYSTTFSSLKVMTLFDFELGESRAIPAVLELLKSAPNLEKLVIYNVQNRGIRRFLPNKVDSNFWKKEYLAGHCFMKLKVVELGYILCMAPEIEFAKFILLNAPILEKMTIGTKEKKKPILTRMLRKLPTLPHASAQVAVTFHDGDSRWRPSSDLEI